LQSASVFRGEYARRSRRELARARHFPHVRFDPLRAKEKRLAVEAGFDSIAHMQLRGTAGSDASKAQIAFFRAHGTVMDPTESWNELGGRPAATPLESLLPGIARLPRALTRMFASMPGGACPLVNISNVRTARMVVANGRLYDCDALWKAAGFVPR
jgi:hypothetical protein